MKRNVPLRSNPDKIREWQQRSRKPLKRGKRINQRSQRRSLETSCYSFAHEPFLDAHRVCPVTGSRTEQIHHSAKREGRWLNLQRYWIAVSAEGHAWIEANKKEAERFGLMVRIRETASEHISSLEEQGVSLLIPLFYDTWDGQPFFS